MNSCSKGGKVGLRYSSHTVEQSAPSLLILSRHTRYLVSFHQKWKATKLVFQTVAHALHAQDAYYYSSYLPQVEERALSDRERGSSCQKVCVSFWTVSKLGSGYDDGKKNDIKSRARQHEFP
jgi:hypothetical protein